MMSSGNKNPEGLFGTVKVGFGAGLVAGCALFSSFLSIDQHKHPSWNFLQNNRNSYGS